MKCGYCERRCELNEGKIGYCGMYGEKDGKTSYLCPNKWSGYYISHIEHLPFFHTYPNSRTLVVSSRGCNFNCSYCMNSYLTKGNVEDVYMFELSPEKIVETAIKSGCHNIVFGMNEFTVSLPSVLEVAKKAKENKIPVGAMTNCYMAEEWLEPISDNISFFNISLKSLSPEFYKKYVGIEDISPIIRNIKYLSKRCHIELTTPIVQCVNDNEIMDIARFISSIDNEIPWHVFRLIPEYNMKDAAYPDIKAINNSLNEARQVLPYIYFSNFAGSQWMSTYCPECGSTAIERVSLGACGGKMLEYLLKDGCCSKCGTKINIFGSYVSWNSREVKE